METLNDDSILYMCEFMFLPDFVMFRAVNSRLRTCTDKALIYRLQLSQFNLRRSSKHTISVRTSQDPNNENSFSSSNLNDALDEDSDSDDSSLTNSLNKNLLYSHLKTSYSTILNFFSSSPTAKPKQSHFSLNLSDDFSPSFRLISGRHDKLVYLSRTGSISTLKLNQYSTRTFSVESDSDTSNSQSPQPSPPPPPTP
ncbi:hypothetical protein TL16_g05083 [Triparma laevis f. inornata]|uniref:Uncharacterized protein n=1 Tax=Triparma laevis f. inornata TaxID=1714386 RepID=A0A9W7AIV0_9STRA|nr:hypothetical protein TL16_g05083 [Triparma laevis f. inornata]